MLIRKPLAANFKHLGRVPLGKLWFVVQAKLAKTMIASCLYYWMRLLDKV
jgi:hypothetical protein